jgi:leucyl-tRNA synthetase
MSWKMVPREPTEAMVDTVREAWTPSMAALWPKIVREVWQKLYDAAPAQPEAMPGREEEWFQDGNLLYTLEQSGWHRGKPEMRNRLEVRVHGGPGASCSEVDALASRLLALLSAKGE